MRITLNFFRFIKSGKSKKDSLEMEQVQERQTSLAAEIVALEKKVDLIRRTR